MYVPWDFFVCDYLDYMFSSFLDEFLLEVTEMEGKGEKKGSFKALPRSAGLFRCNRESTSEKMQKQGQNILVHTWIFIFFSKD